jgi:hypothetical protein
MRAFLAVTLLSLAAVPALATSAGNTSIPNAATCETLAKEIEAGTQKVPRNVALFNHQEGQLVWPAPAKLEVPDQGIFVVVFTHTDPTKFDYSITSLNDSDATTIDLKADGKGVQAATDNTVCVSWRHGDEFPVYRVAITLRATASVKDAKEKLNQASLDAKVSSKAMDELNQEIEGYGAKAPEKRAPEDVARLNRSILNAAAEIQDEAAQQRFMAEANQAVVAVTDQTNLFPYTFPIWVETSDAQLRFSTGIGFSSLTNDRFFIEGEGTAQKVRKAHGGKDDFRPDLMAFATLIAPNKESWGPWGNRLGLTAGLGVGDDSNPRYFLGGSLVLSHRMVLSLGAVGAKVSRLPAGQALNEKPISANVLSSLDSGFKIGWGLSMSFKLGKDGGEFFKGLNPSQKVTGKPEGSGK